MIWMKETQRRSTAQHYLEAAHKHRYKRTQRSLIQRKVIFFQSPDKQRGYRTTLRKKERTNYALLQQSQRKKQQQQQQRGKLDCEQNYEPVSEVAIRRGTPQGDSLSPELFVIATFRLTCIHAIAGYFSQRERECILLLFKDDVKLYGRDKIAVARTRKISK